MAHAERSCVLNVWRRVAQALDLPDGADGDRVPRTVLADDLPDHVEAAEDIAATRARQIDIIAQRAARDRRQYGKG